MSPERLPPGVYLSAVPSLRNSTVRYGERYVYSAGFNVRIEAVEGASRIDEELPDLAHLSNRGARVVILSHGPADADGTPGGLEHIAACLSDRLGLHVLHVGTSIDYRALRAAEDLSPGEVLLLGNTRREPGETRGDEGLAAAFAQLGRRSVVGGFSKAHRSHSSNTGLARLLPAVASSGLLREVERLAPWATTERSGGYSLASLGGLKREKLDALPVFAATYDAVIPGGAVLNALLAARGVDVAASSVGECGGRERWCRDVLRQHDSIRLPEQVLVTQPGNEQHHDLLLVNTIDGVPADHAIVDFVLSEQMLMDLEHLTESGGRAILAGPPSRADDGHLHAATAILKAMASPGVAGIVVGGDSAADLPWNGTTSSGGGSALAWLAQGRLAVLDVLRSTGGAGV